ncbi:MAG: hypothetical protein KGV59_07575 [Tenacibaculum sp.]|nr:hypothetical protein [Tenacibaculum sp.]
MKKYTFRISIKWYKNDSGGDVRTIGILYKDEADKKAQIDKILNDFRTKPMTITGNEQYDRNAGKIPYSVTTKIPSFRKY